MLFAFIPMAHAQYATVFTATGSYDVGEELQVEITDLDDVADPGDVVVFLYRETFTGGPNDPLDQDDLPWVLKEYVCPATIPATVTITGKIEVEGTFDLWVGVYEDGLYDHLIYLDEEHILSFSGANDPFGYYGNLGARSVTTNAFALNALTIATLTVEVDVVPANLDPTYPLLVEYSVNGGNTWAALSIGGVTEFDADGPYVFDLTEAANDDALTAATHFRVRQKNSVSLAAGNEAWNLDDITITKGTPINLIGGQASSSSYNIAEPTVPGPSLTLNSIENDETVPAIISSEYPGQKITLKATGANFPNAYNTYKYAIGMGGISSKNYYPDDNYLWFNSNVTPAISGNDLTFSLVDVPVNVYEWLTNEDINIWVYTGTSIDYGSDNIVYELQEEDLAFEDAGIRSFITEEYTIAANQVTGNMFSFDLTRLSNPVATFGSQVYVAYTLNGTTWVGLDTISLNHAGIFGNTYEYYDLPAGTIQFRLDQKNPFPAGVNTWLLEDAELFLPGNAEQNILVVSSGYNFTITPPVLNVELKDAATLPNLYPGDNITFNITNPSGTFPTGTVFEYGFRKNGVIHDYIVLGTATTIANKTLTIPYIPQDLYTFYIVAETRDDYTYGYSETFAVYAPGNLNIDEVSTTYEEYNYPTNTVDVDYTFTGPIGANLDLEVILEMEMNDGADFWYPIAAVDYNPAGGTISGVIPSVDPMSGVVYGDDIRIRLDYKGEPDYINDDFDRTWGMPHGFWYAEGLRYGAKVWVDAVVEQEVNLWASLDWGTTYDVEIDTKTKAAGTKGLLYSYITDMYEFPENTGGTVFFDIDYELGEGNTVIGKGYRLDHAVEISNTATAGINILVPSISLGDLEDEYFFGGTIDVSYGIDMAAQFPTGTKFAVVLQQDGYYGPFYTLEVSDDQDYQVDLDALVLPTEADLDAYGFDTEDSYDVVVYAFDGEELILSELLYEIDSFYGINGSENGYEAGTESITFDEQDIRWAVSDGFDMSVMPSPAFVEFYYNTNDVITAPNPLTLPQVHISLDNGVTWEPLDTLPAISLGNEKITVEIEKETGVDYSNVRIRWYQEVPDGKWTISQMKIVGVNNEVEFWYAYINGQEIDLIYEGVDCSTYNNSFTAYEWSVVYDEPDPDGFEQPVYAGEEFEFTWEYPTEPESKSSTLKIDAAGLVKEAIANSKLATPEFPEETEFYFYINKKASAYTKGSTVIWSEDFSLFDDFATDLTAWSWSTVDTWGSATWGAGDFDFPNEYSAFAWMVMNPETTTPAISGDHPAYEGSKYMFSAASNPMPISGEENKWLISPEIDLSGVTATQVKLSFAAKSISAEFGYERFKVHAWDGASWVQINSGYDEAPTSWSEFVYDISSYIGNSDFKFAVESVSHDAFMLFLDAFEVYEQAFPSTLIPINIDGLPITMDMEEMNALIPDTVNTGVYEVWVSAILPSPAKDAACEWDPYMLKDNLLVVNENDVPEPVAGIYIEDILNADGETDVDYLIDEEFQVMYSTYGEMPEGLQFAAIMTQDETTKVVYGEFGEETGVNQVLDLQMFLNPFYPEGFFGYDTDYDLQLVAFEGDDLVMGETIPVDLDEEGDFLAVDGWNEDTEEFSNEGNRYALTSALDLTGLAGNAVLQFRYSANDIFVNPLTLPMLSVSIDGGETFEFLTIENSEFGEWGLLDASATNKLYTIVLDEEYITDATHFMWKQQVNREADEDVWSINNIQITSGDGNIVFWSDIVGVTLDIPYVATNYELSVILDENGFEPVMYPGGTYELDWQLATNEDGDTIGVPYPAGTNFEFDLVDVDGNWTTVYATLDTGSFEITIPEDFERGVYDVYAWVYTTESDKKFVPESMASRNAAAKAGFFQYEYAPVGSVSVFNHVLTTELIGEEVVYGGSTVNFTASFENLHEEDITPNTSYWYNLVMRDATADGDILLAAQQGSVDFTDVVLPTFVNGVRDIEIVPSEGAALGIVGEYIESVGAKGVALPDGGNLAVEANPGLYSEKEIEVDINNELYAVIDFAIHFSRDFDLITDDQKVVFEYSIDGGLTYKKLATYPDARFNDPDNITTSTNDGLDYFEERIFLPADSKTDATLFRWRTMETKGNVILGVRGAPWGAPEDYILTDRVLFLAYLGVPVAPYFPEAYELNIIKQRVDVIAVDPDGHSMDCE
ncbi:MAG TPA: hypothetical protein PK563_14490, partial [Tenuifilaceae bacterium]|nr:hypothetical protein [Tenuifilaceae bacterium]